MELIRTGIDIFLHIDEYLNVIVKNYGVWTYLVLFFVIFMETGFVVTPFLPGDSLLFAAGAFAARGSLEVEWLFILLSIAAVAGDTVNYWIGHYVGPKVFDKENSRLFNKEHLDRTHEFYERHGGKTIIIARYLPIVRTFAPFVAGIGRMSYGRFISYNVIGGIAWIAIFTFGGYLFGNLPAVESNFEWVIVVIIIISLLPTAIETLRHRARSAQGA